MPRRGFLLIGMVALVPLLHGCLGAVAVGAGATALVAEDRRTTGIYFEDQNIELKATKVISDKYGKNDKINTSVISFNRYVLIVGQVPDEGLKKQIGVTVLGIENVRSIQNDLVIGPPASFGQHTSDTYITSKVKAQFITANKFQINYVKVVTEDDVVYLMGLVTKKEGDDATDIARGVGGVKKVVRVFEYMD
jgi:osmotically-inducible protein OsmY